MGKEIERKFLIDSDLWNYQGEPVKMVQGYLTIDQSKIIRVRVADKQAFITIKSNVKGISRDEFEYEIPVDDALKLLPLCINSVVKKTRYEYWFAGKLWEIDVFEGDNSGLIVAEIELEHEDEQFELPSWALTEVSIDEKYYNFNLSLNPYKNWQ